MKDGTATTSTPARNKKSPPPPPEAAAGVRCPRCDSANTKFCYYNNYSLTQPRHFCKTCRRYWTKGGALRNVPIGGGCRKNKKLKPSPDIIGGAGLKFFEGLSPAMDFQISGIATSPPPFPRFHNHDNHRFAYNPASGPTGISYGPVLGGPIQEIMNNSNNNVNIASSIESLSFMNQDLHWKLQQQRLALLFGNGDINKEHNNNVTSTENSGGGDVAAGWFFGNSYVNQATVGGDGSEIGQAAAGVSWNNGFGAWNDHS